MKDIRALSVVYYVQCTQFIHRKWITNIFHEDIEFGKDFRWLHLLHSWHLSTFFFLRWFIFTISFSTFGNALFIGVTCSSSSSSHEEGLVLAEQKRFLVGKACHLTYFLSCYLKWQASWISLAGFWSFQMVCYLASDSQGKRAHHVVTVMMVTDSDS